MRYTDPHRGKRSWENTSLEDLTEEFVELSKAVQRMEDVQETQLHTQAKMRARKMKDTLDEIIKRIGALQFAVNHLR